MFKRVVLALAVALLAVPAVSDAAFDSFYSTCSGCASGDPLAIAPGEAATINLFFDTNAVDLSGFGATGVFGWGLQLQGDPDIALSNGVNGGDVDPLSNCLGAGARPNPCSALDAGAGAASGVSGIGVAMLSIDILGTVAGAQLVATTANFTEGDFSTTSAAPTVLAQIVPEPNTAVLLGVGLAGLAFLRRRS